jgi:protein-disulfide isomerase
MLLRRSFLVLALICLGCAAQSVSTEINQRIDREVRHYYNLPPSVNLTIGPLHPSEFPGYDAVTITMQGGDKKQDYDFLLSKDDKTLIRMTKMDLSKDPFAETMKKISTGGRPIRGNKDAKVVVVNFDDFECPFCSRMHQTLFPELLKEYGDRVEFVYKDYPLVDIHPWATHAAVDANCLAGQSSDAYWDFADYIHANQREVSSQKDHEAQFAELDKLTTEQGQKHSVDLAKLQSCIKAQNEDAVKASIHEGDAIGVTATPTLFVNGQELDGALPASEMRATLDRALQQAGVAAPAHPVPSAGGGPQAPSK